MTSAAVRAENWLSCASWPTPFTYVKKTGHAWITPLLSSWILIFPPSLRVFIRISEKGKENMICIPLLHSHIRLSKQVSRGWRLGTGIFYMESLLLSKHGLTGKQLLLLIMKNISTSKLRAGTAHFKENALLHQIIQSICSFLTPSFCNPRTLALPCQLPELPSPEGPRPLLSIFSQHPLSFKFLKSLLFTY